MTLTQFVLQLVAMLILAGAATFALLLAVFHAVDRWSDR